MYSVYVHIFPNGKYYVGITSRDVKARWGYGNNYHNCIAVDRAIKKYGWNNIKHYVVRVVETKEEAERIEKLLIFKLGSNDRRFGYNILPGGDARGELPEESKKRIGEKNKKKWENDPQRRKDASDRMKKRMEDPEYKKKIYEAFNNARHKNGDRLKKKVAQIDLDGNVIKIWDGLIDVEKSGIATRQAISQCCLGQIKTVKGFVWKFEV